MKFRIVVPTYNAAQWIIPCLYSIKTQIFKDFECVIVNDASTDNTASEIENLDFIQDDSRFSVINLDKNGGPLSSHVVGFNSLGVADNPEDVYITVDGDDRLFSPHSLEICRRYYEKFNPLLTFGNHIHYPTGDASNCEWFPEEVLKEGSYRKYKFVSSHLRTIKGHVWNAIDKNDLKDEDGEYFKAAGDFAYMIPALELAAGRTLMIPQVLYVYNRLNPLSEEYAAAQNNARIVDLVRSRKVYKPI